MSFGTTPPRNDYLGNGTTATYSFGFRIFAATDLKVSAAAPGAAPTLLLYPSDFSVPAASINNVNGGTITLLNTGVLDGSGFLKTGWALTIRFSEVTNQPTDLRNQGGFFLEVIEDMVDRAVRFVQQVEDIVSRSLHLPETEAGTAANSTLPIKAVRALMYLGFDASGNPVALAAPANTTAVSTFMAGLLTKADAAAALGGLWVDAISPAQITANQNDYNPAGLSTVNALRLTTDASRNLTGLTTGVDGRMVAIFNTGSFNLVLINESGSSTAANRFTLTGDVTLLPNASILLRYDGSTSRWRPVLAPLNAGTGIGITGGIVSLLTQVCQFRLTLTSGVPVTTSDVLAATTLYATPTGGNLIGLFDGVATWNVRASAEMSVAVPATTSTPFDVFCYDNAGVPTLETVNWTNDTTRATALVLQNGVYVKSGATTRRYLGTGRTTTVSGQTEDSLAKRYVWNYYNRKLRPMKVVEATASWTYTTATYRQANANAANQLDCVIGVAEDAITVDVYAIATNASAVNLSTGIGINVTNAQGALINHSVTTGAGAGVYDPCDAHYNGIPAIGRTFYAWLEFSGAAGTTTWYGAGSTPQCQNGITGEVWA